MLFPGKSFASSLYWLRLYTPSIYFVYIFRLREDRLSGDGVASDLVVRIVSRSGRDGGAVGPKVRAEAAAPFFGLEMQRIRFRCLFRYGKQAAALPDQMLFVDQAVTREVLDDREFEIIKLRYGLGGVGALTQREVAQKFDISRSYVSRIEKKALDKIKNVISKEDLFL